jgi:hypothetical protein
VILELVESDRPKSLGEKIAEYLARPPQPILRFYGNFRTETANHGRNILFAVRNGLPLPLFYGLYLKVEQNSSIAYIEKTDHIGPFSVDDYRLKIDTTDPATLDIRVGVLPFEILTDRAQLAI